jgi:YidC/Oxa1 family membrane protein insertase
VVVVAPSGPRAPNLAADAAPVARERERLVRVESPLYRFTFSSRGVRLVGATAREYRTFAPGDSGPAELVPPDSRFLEYLLVVGSDTLALADWTFVPSDTVVEVRDGGTSLSWVGRRGAATVRLTQTFRRDSYLFDVRGSVTGIAGSGLVLVRLGPRLGFVEADSAEDFRQYSVVTKASKTERVNFRSLTNETRALEGPFEWVAIKSKYFVGAVLAIDEGIPKFGGALAAGRERVGKFAINTDVLASLPAPRGRFEHSVYLGPQEFRRLARIGHDLQDVNPYGWFLRPIIRPFANLIVRILLWMHETLSLSYGWVLILFGLAVRALLWPLNQKAMRSSVAMQAIQPELKAIQERHKQEPQKLQQEMMKLYREHKVSPLGGCLPMLIPMPVLFALFFVFRETIEFRGVPFLWLPDLSRADPYFIIPIFMGISMYVLTRIGQIGIPPNPQAKMMLYIMPGFLTLIFLKFSSGLNLYYAVSNLASLPQQWLIARERLRKVGKRE